MFPQYQALVDPATGGFKAGYDLDGVHLTAAGYLAAAKATAAYFEREMAPCW